MDAFLYLIYSFILVDPLSPHNLTSSFVDFKKKRNIIKIFLLVDPLQHNMYFQDLLGEFCQLRFEES